MGKQPPQRTTAHWIITGRHRHPHRINRHTGRRAKKRFLKNNSDSNFQISDFSIQLSFHVLQSCASFYVCYVAAAIFPRPNSRMSITALQLNSRCMNTHLPTSSHLGLPPVFEKSAESGDLCVSHPGQRVFHHHSFHSTQAGGSRESTVLLPTKTAVDIP